MTDFIRHMATTQGLPGAQEAGAQNLQGLNTQLTSNQQERASLMPGRRQLSESDAKRNIWTSIQPKLKSLTEVTKLREEGVAAGEFIKQQSPDALASCPNRKTRNSLRGREIRGTIREVCMSTTSWGHRTGSQFKPTSEINTRNADGNPAGQYGLPQCGS